MQRVTGAGVTVLQMAETRRTTSAQRMTIGDRKRLGLRPVEVILSERESFAECGTPEFPALAQIAVRQMGRENVELLTAA